MFCMLLPIFYSFNKISREKENIIKIIRKRKHIYIFIKNRSMLNGPIEFEPLFFKGQL